MNCLHVQFTRGFLDLLKRPSSPAASAKFFT
jgi:hypothetical protein